MIEGRPVEEKSGLEVVQGVDDTVKARDEVCAFLSVIIRSTVTISVHGFMFFSFSAAETTFFLPMSPVQWRICRFRFLSLTSSWSISPIVPTPAAARYRATVEPRPPTPAIATLARFSRSWPACPISLISICRSYRSNSPGVSTGSVSSLFSCSLPLSLRSFQGQESGVQVRAFREFQAAACRFRDPIPCSCNSCSAAHPSGA